MDIGSFHGLAQAMMNMGFSHLTPLTVQHTAESNATERLLSVRELGLQMVADPVEKRIRANAREMRDHQGEIYRWQAEVLDQLKKLPGSRAGEGASARPRFQAILFHWLVYDGPEYDDDPLPYPYASLMLTDATTKRFLVIETQPVCNHFAAVRAHELFCLVTYLGPTRSGCAAGPCLATTCPPTCSSTSPARGGPSRRWTPAAPTLPSTPACWAWWTLTSPATRPSGTQSSATGRPAAPRTRRRCGGGS